MEEVRLLWITFTCYFSHTTYNKTMVHLVQCMKGLNFAALPIALFALLFYLIPASYAFTLTSSTGALACLTTTSDCEYQRHAYLQSIPTTATCRRFYSLKTRGQHHCVTPLGAHPTKLVYRLAPIARYDTRQNTLMKLFPSVPTPSEVPAILFNSFSDKKEIIKTKLGFKLKKFFQRKRKEAVEWEWEARPLQIDEPVKKSNITDDISLIKGDVEVDDIGNFTSDDGKSNSSDKNSTSINIEMSDDIDRKNKDSKQSSPATDRASRKPLKRKVKGFVRFVTLAVLVTVVAPFMRIDEDESGDITGVSFKAPLQIAGVPLNVEDEENTSGYEDKDTEFKYSLEEAGGSDDIDDIDNVDDPPVEITNLDERDETELETKVDKTDEEDQENKASFALPPSQLGTKEKSTASASKSSTAAYYRTTMGYVAEAVAKTGPAVLRIDTETDIERAVHMGEQIDDQGGTYPEQNQDDERDGEEMDGIPDRLKFIQQGQGSGVIFCKEGLVLTNAHVVQGASRVTVTLTDGRRFRAEVKGADDIVDIAVLKILFENENDNSKGNKVALPVAEFGDSDELQVGQFVVAVGSPGGLDNTVTMGIISGLKRSSEVVGLMHKKVDFIQTDAGKRLILK